MADVLLICNVPNCNKKLLNEAFVTVCSHIFCKNHGEEMMDMTLDCLICNTKLNGQFGLLSVNLRPSNQYKSMILNGLHPEQILDIAGRAIQFFVHQISYQTQLKDNALKNVKKQHEESSKSVKIKYNQELLQMQKIAESINEDLRKKIKELELQRQRNVELTLKNLDLQAKKDAYKKEIILQQMRKDLTFNHISHDSSNFMMNNPMVNPFEDINPDIFSHTK